MSYKYSQYSIMDFISDYFPISKKENNIDNEAATDLYNIWKDSKSNISTTVLRKPTTLPAHKVEIMQKAGLVYQNGNNLEITNKGKDVIKIMILGNDSSIFDEKRMDYISAKNNTGVRTAKKIGRIASNIWWERFEK